jgi:TonB family protein
MRLPKLNRRIIAGLLISLTALILSAPSALGQDSDARKLRTKIAPTYPDLAKRTNISGTVKIEVVIAPSGSIKSTKVIGGHPLLVGAAEEALRKWKYETASSETTTVVEFHFTPGT